MKFLILNLLLLSNFAIAETVVEVVTPKDSIRNISYPFMNCSAPDDDSDFSKVTLMVNASKPETGMVVTIRNPKFDEFLKEQLADDTDQDVSDFDFSPIHITSNDLKIEKLSQEGLYQIAGGAIGFAVVANQVVDIKNVKGSLKLNSLLDDEVIELNCSIHPSILDRVFE